MCGGLRSRRPEQISSAAPSRTQRDQELTTDCAGTNGGNYEKPPTPLARNNMIVEEEIIHRVVARAVEISTALACPDAVGSNM